MRASRSRRRSSSASQAITLAVTRPRRRQARVVGMSDGACPLCSHRRAADTGAQGGSSCRAASRDAAAGGLLTGIPARHGDWGTRGRAVECVVCACCPVSASRARYVGSAASMAITASVAGHYGECGCLHGPGRGKWVTPPTQETVGQHTTTHGAQGFRLRSPRCALRSSLACSVCGAAYTFGLLQVPHMYEGCTTSKEPTSSCGCGRSPHMRQLALS